MLEALRLDSKTDKGLQEWAYNYSSFTDDTEEDITYA